VIIPALLVAVAVSACGERGSIATNADSSGLYTRAGELTYQVQISRELNQYSTEDMQYLQGLPPGTIPPAPDEEWFAVFMWAKNFTDRSHTTLSTADFSIIDTQGNTYRPIAINPTRNLLAWTAQTLRPQDSEPAPDTPAFYSPSQGAELLFKVNDSVYANRPLTLVMHAPGQAHPSTIPLDL
jgi:hypothetical protein